MYKLPMRVALKVFLLKFDLHWRTRPRLLIYRVVCCGLISTLWLCRGLSSLGDRWHSFLFILAISAIALHTHTRVFIVRRIHTISWHETWGVGSVASVRFSLQLPCVLMYLRILFCHAIVWMELEAHHWKHKVTEHISTKSPICSTLSLHKRLSSFSLFEHTHPHTCTFLLQSLSYSLSRSPTGDRTMPSNMSAAMDSQTAKYQVELEISGCEECKGLIAASDYRGRRDSKTM